MTSHVSSEKGTPVNDTHGRWDALTGIYEMSDYKLPHIDENRLALITAYVTLFILGTAGNAWVVFVVGRVFRQSRTEAPKSVQLFILSLCLCELSMLIFMILLLGDLIFGRWVVPSRFLCQLYLSSEGMNKFCSPFLLASLSGFCYVRLRGPPTAAHSTASTRKAIYLVTFCVFSSFILMTPVYEYGNLYYLVQYNETHNETHVLNMVPKCAFHPPERVMIAFTAYGFIIGYVIPGALFTFFYSASLYSARRQRKRSSCYQNPAPSITGDPRQSSASREGSQRKQKGQIGDPLVANGSPYLKRVRTTTFALVFVYLAVWTPYWVMSIWQCLTPHESHGHESQITIVLSYFIHMLPYLNCAIFPLVYTLLNSHLKKDYKRAKAAERRRRLAGRKSRRRLPLLRVQMRPENSGRGVVTLVQDTRGSIDVTSTNRSSLDATISKSAPEESGYRKSSSCQLFMPVEDRYFLAKSTLRRTLTPVLYSRSTPL